MCRLYVDVVSCMRPARGWREHCHRGRSSWHRYGRQWRRPQWHARHRTVAATGSRRDSDDRSERRVHDHRSPGRPVHRHGSALRTCREAGHRRAGGNGARLDRKLDLNWSGCMKTPPWPPIRVGSRMPPVSRSLSTSSQQTTCSSAPRRSSRRPSKAKPRSTFSERVRGWPVYSCGA